MYRKLPELGITSALAVAVPTPLWSSVAVTRITITSPWSAWVARSRDVVVAPGITTPLRNHLYARVTGSPSASDAESVAVTTSTVLGEPLLKVTLGTAGAFAITT